MDISLFYQLRDRLYAAAAAGCSCINEDFRLKRALEQFEPLSKSNKVFARIYDMCGRLFTSENPAPELADCIALCDAVAVTQGTFQDKSETAPEKGVECSVPYVLRYSVLEQVQDMFRHWVSALSDDYCLNQSLLKEPRIINMFFRKIGSETESFAEFTKRYLPMFGKDIIPLLKERTDLTNPKSKGKTVEYVGLAAGAEENDWYISLIENEEAPPDVRAAAVRNLGYSKDNAQRLLEIYRTGKVKMKNAAANALIKLNVPESTAILEKICGKFTVKNADYIAASTNKIAVDFALDNAQKFLDGKSEYDYKIIIKMLSNKPEAEEILLKLTKKDTNTSGTNYAVGKMLVSNIINNKDEELRVLIENLYRKAPDYFGMPYLFLITSEDRGVKLTDVPELIDKYRYNFIMMFREMRYDKINNTYLISNLTPHSMEKLSPVPAERLNEIFEVLTDTSYFKTVRKTLFLKKRKYFLNSVQTTDENKYAQLCLTNVCDILGNIVYAVPESERNKFEKARRDFFRIVLNECPNDETFSYICVHEPEYIRENPELLEKFILFSMEYSDRCSYVSSYLLKNVPADVMDKVIMPLYKKLLKLNERKFKPDALKNQLQIIISYMKENGYLK